MEEVIGWFGEGSLHLVAGVIFLVMVAAVFRSGGSVYEAVYCFMTSICG